MTSAGGGDPLQLGLFGDEVPGSVPEPVLMALHLGPVIDLGPAVAGTPDRIAAIAEEARAGNGASVYEYVKDLERAFAIPILRVTEYPGLSVEELRAELSQFHPPQGYVRLAQHPDLLAVCGKVAEGVPVREMTVDQTLARSAGSSAAVEPHCGG